MDDQRLGELFRAAAGDVPPASFDEKDIAAASRRITQRRHSMLLGGGGLAVVLLAVGLVFGIGVLVHTVGSGVANSGAAAGARGPVGSTGQAPFAAPRIARDSPGAAPMQGGIATGKVGPGADGTHAGCGPVDGALAVALAGEIPSAGARVPVPASVLCPEGSRSAAISVPGGVVTAVLVPVRSAFDHPGLSPATSGAWAVLVESTPTSALPAAQLAQIQQQLAARY